MRTGWMLVAAALCACGGGETKRVVTVDAGRAGRDAPEPEDAGKPDAATGGKGGVDAQPNELGGAGGAEAGSGGAPTGGMAAGGSGGSRPPEPQPEGGAGAGGSGGSPAPQERVLWSQSWTVEVHEAKSYGAVAGTKMALILDAGQLCRFGFMVADSGTSQEYETDGKCITAYSAPMGGPAFYAPDGSSSNAGGRVELMGWKEAVQGKTVVKLRRTQTYEVQILGSGNDAWAYADFSGVWEAIGY